MSNKFTVSTYSPSDVILSFGGYQISGWDNITVARRAQGFITVPGIRGKHTRVPSGDTSATITISLIQTSQSNDVLSEIHRLDLENGTARIALTLKDKSGNSVFSSDEAYIVGYPESVFSGGFEQRVWTLFCQTSKSFVVGGNGVPSTSIFNAAIGAVTNLITNNN